MLSSLLHPRPAYQQIGIYLATTVFRHIDLCCVRSGGLPFAQPAGTCNFLCCAADNVQYCAVCQLNSLVLQKGSVYADVSPSVLQGLWMVTKGVLDFKPATLCPDALNINLEQMRFESVNMWPMFGLVNRTGTSIGVTKLDTSWPTHRLCKSLFKMTLWYLVTFDMFPAVCSFIAFLCYAPDILDYLEHQQDDYRYLYYQDLLPTFVYMTFYMPAFSVASTGRWHRLYGIIIALVTWVMMLWWRRGATTSC